MFTVSPDSAGGRPGAQAKAGWGGESGAGAGGSGRWGVNEVIKVCCGCDGVACVQGVLDAAIGLCDVNRGVLTRSSTPLVAIGLANSRRSDVTYPYVHGS